MYQIYVCFKCVPGKREGFVEKVKQEGILDAVRAEEGCLRYDYYFSDSDPDELVLVEVWETQEHQKVHIGQPHMAALRSFRGDYIMSSKLGEFEIK